MFQTIEDPSTCHVKGVAIRESGGPKRFMLNEELEIISDARKRAQAGEKISSTEKQKIRSELKANNLRHNCMLVSVGLRGKIVRWNVKMPSATLKAVQKAQNGKRRKSPDSQRKAAQKVQDNNLEVIVLRNNRKINVRAIEETSTCIVLLK